MEYFKVGDGKFIEYDAVTERARIIVKKELQQQKQELQERIDTADPNMPSSKDAWAAWGKANYPYMDHSAEQAELDRINAVLDAIKAL